MGPSVQFTQELGYTSLLPTFPQRAPKTEADRKGTSLIKGQSMRELIEASVWPASVHLELRRGVAGALMIEWREHSGLGGGALRIEWREHSSTTTRVPSPPLWMDDGCTLEPWVLADASATALQ